MGLYCIVFAQEPGHFPDESRCIETCEIYNYGSVASAFQVEATSFDDAWEKARERRAREGDGIFETYDPYATRCAIRYDLDWFYDWRDKQRALAEQRRETANAIIKEAEQRAKELSEAGWTREDFAKALGELLQVEDK